MLETLANLGEFIGAIGVIVSIGYLAVQIRQNTKAVRSSSYHQAAEQTWSACLALAQDGELAALLAKSRQGEPLTLDEEMRRDSYEAAMIFGFENMLRLHEEGLLDAEIYRNVIDNSLPYLASQRVQGVLAQRPGPLSGRLADEVRTRAQALDVPSL